MSNIEWFKYELIWEKSNSTAHVMANIRPLKSHENICVFYKRQPTYNPQKEVGIPYGWRSKRTDSIHLQGNKNTPIFNRGDRFPRSVKKFKQERGLHPTQKPVPLFEYLIRTYTNEGDIVLDNAAGCGTTGVACKQSRRNYLLIDKDEKYYKLMQERLLYVRRGLL